VPGLLSDLPRKNGWSIAEWAGEATPDGMQHLLGRARWDAGAVRDDVHDWAVIDLAERRPGSGQLLIRRNRTTGELACCRCFSPAPAPLTALVRIAGSRWRVEKTFQSGKGLAGLDEHQVRHYTSWSRWVTLAMLANAFLAVVRADEHARRPAPDGLIPLTCNEIQRLFITLIVRPVREVAHRLAWSAWRRRHQARAQVSHYQRQAANQT
jgi:SRSO17 transposase